MDFKGRRFVIAIGIVFIAVLGWLTGYMITTPLVPLQAPVNTEMAQLQQDLTEYIAAKLKTEKHDSQLLSLSLLAPVPQADGLLNIPYALSFRDGVDGNSATSSIQATAVLKRVQDAWRVVKVLTERETVVYENPVKITPDHPVPAVNEYSGGKRSRPADEPSE